MTVTSMTWIAGLSFGGSVVVLPPLRIKFYFCLSRRKRGGRLISISSCIDCTSSNKEHTMTCIWSTTLLLLSFLHSGAGFAAPNTAFQTPSSVVVVGPLHAAAPRLTPDQQDNNNNNNNKQHPPSGPLTFHDSIKEFFLNLARLSLRDYEWRSSVFKSTEADRLLEESLARMQGINRPYLRPMDASDEKIGPLGRWEKSTVEWLASVIDEEGRRARKIVSQDGKLVRPIETDANDLGPLGFLEKQASDFLQTIRRSEEERVRTKTLRPMDLQDDVRGPLGALELKISRFLRELRESEKLRAEQSKRRGGEMVRPIDVPGPLGEWELKVAEVLRAEEMRAMQLNKNEGRVIRPKDANYQGPLGVIEEKIYEFFDALRAEENERLQSMRQLLQDKRPMETDRKSFLGVAETVVVGIVRAPQMIYSVFQRVAELLRSEPLPADERERSTKNSKKE